MAAFNKHARHFAVRRMGTDVTVHNWEHDGSTDKYGDPDPDGWTETTTSTKAIIQQGQDTEIIDRPDGASTEEEVVFFLPGDIDVHVASDADRVRATHITIDTNSREYRVHDDWPDYHGLTVATCRRDNDA